MFNSGYSWMTSTTLQLVTELCQGLLSVTGGRAALDPLLSEQLCKQAKRGKTESSLPHLSHQKSVFAPCAQSKVIVLKLYQLYSIIYTHWITLGQHVIQCISTKPSSLVDYGAFQHYI